MSNDSSMPAPPSRIGAFVRRVPSSSVAWGWVLTLVRGLGFFVVMAFALRTIPSHEIGLWYVMLGIAGLGNIVEFGFATTIGRYASYYSGGAVVVPRLGTVRAVPGAMNKRAIAGLVVMARRLYGVFGLSVGGLMLVVWTGWMLWGEELAADVSRREIAAFGLLVAGTSLNMTNLFWTAVLYGMNHVRRFNQWAVVGLVVNYVVALAGLAAGGGILALVAGQVVGNAVPRLAAKRIVGRELAGAQAGDDQPVSWRHLWPATWRAGVLTLCTYLTITTTTLFCYAFADLTTAASYGLTMQLALMLHTTSTQWVWVKIPEINALRVQGDWRQVLRVLEQRLPLSIGTYLLGAGVAVVAAPWALELLRSRTPMLPGPAMTLLLALIGLDLIVGLHSALLQTGNEMPHVRAFGLSALVTLLLVWPLASRYQVWGVMAAPLIAQALVVYWWVPLQFWTRLRGGLAEQDREPVGRGAGAS